jgi:lysylphosphatidylglycerol synthetase-like protein (DUF2156 family)
VCAPSQRARHCWTASWSASRAPCSSRSARPVVDHLHGRHGYYGTQFGSESKILLADWSLRGARKQIIRTAVNGAAAAGIEIREGGFDHDVKRISEAWIRTRRCKNNEIRFLIRPMIIDYREGTRYFYAHTPGGDAVGFIFFDPIWQRRPPGRLCAEHLAFVRQLPPGPVVRADGACAGRVQGRGRALRRPRPGAAADGGRVEPQESRLLRATMSVIRERMDFLYNFKGLEFAKSRFQGRVEKTYCCHRSAMPALAMTAMFRLTRII